GLWHGRWGVVSAAVRLLAVGRFWLWPVFVVLVARATPLHREARPHRPARHRSSVHQHAHHRGDTTPQTANQLSKELYHLSNRHVDKHQTNNILDNIIKLLGKAA